MSTWSITNLHFVFPLYDERSSPEGEVDDGGGWRVVVYISPGIFTRLAKWIIVRAIVDYGFT